MGRCGGKGAKTGTETGTQIRVNLDWVARGRFTRFLMGVKSRNGRLFHNLFRFASAIAERAAGFAAVVPRVRDFRLG